MSPQCLPPSFSLIRLTIREQMSFQDFQAGHHGSHLGYWNKMNCAILNLHVTTPTMFGLNPTYRSTADVVWRFSRWPPWRPSWISERNVSINSESLCCSKASRQVSAQSDLQSGRRYPGYWNRMILAILTLYVAQMPPTKFGLNLT